MKQIAALALSGFLLASPALAEDTQTDIDEGFNLVEKGMLLFFKGLTEELEAEMDDFAKELEPALKDFVTEMEPAMRGLLESMGPKLEELAELIGEIDDYHSPEKLPNGDIILRRKTVPNPLAEGETDL